MDIKIHLMLEVMLILLTPQTIFHYQVQMIYQIHLKILMPLFEPATSTPTEKPSVTVSPTKKPTPTKAPTSTPKVVKKKISKSKKTKTKVCLLSNTGKVLKEVKFNKKTGIMVYNKKKIKKVKDVFFTKKVL